MSNDNFDFDPMGGAQEAAGAAKQAVPIVMWTLVIAVLLAVIAVAGLLLMVGYLFRWAYVRLIHRMPLRRFAAENGGEDAVTGPAAWIAEASKFQRVK